METTQVPMAMPGVPRLLTLLSERGKMPEEKEGRGWGVGPQRRRRGEGEEMGIGSLDERRGPGRCLLYI